MANIFEFLSKDGNITPEKVRKSRQMQFRDKTAYVWGLCYRWDPSLSRNPVPRFLHFMPPCYTPLARLLHVSYFHPIVEWHGESKKPPRVFKKYGAFLGKAMTPKEYALKLSKKKQVGGEEGGLATTCPPWLHVSSLLPASLLSLEHNQPNNNYRADQKCKSRKSYFVSDLSDIVYFFLSAQNIILYFSILIFSWNKCVQLRFSW